MTRSELITRVAEANGLTAAEARGVIDAVFGRILEGLAEGHRVELRDFGVFTAKHYGPRRRRNPRTGETLTAATAMAVHFKTGRGLHAAINKDMPN